jgi:myo-inositol-1(or 4)-monophosphatase
VLASRSEVRRGEWERFADADFTVRPCGSVAYKLGLVAAGLADATWTLVPKNEWDVAAGAALVLAAGGAVMHADGRPARFNRRSPALPDFLAGPPALIADFRARWLPEETRG